MMLILINIFIIMLPTCLLMYYSTNLLSKNDNNTILLTKILPSKINEPEILDIIKRFKKDNLKMTILFAIMYTPCYLMKKYTAFSIIYMVLWFFIICLFTALLTKKYMTEIRTLKKEKGWYITKKSVARVDTNVSKIKNKMPISNLWFIPSFIICIVAYFFKVDIFLCLCFFITALSLLIINIVFNKSKTIVYSNNSEINIACNYIYRRNWSIIWALSAFITSLPVLFFIKSYSLAFIATLISVILLCFIIFYGNYKTKNAQNKLLNNDKDMIFYDDDEYWGCFFYNNPNDSSMMVETRNGMGTTVNIGSKAGKGFVIGVSIFTLAILLFTFILIIKLDNASFSLNITNNTTAKIEAPLYDIEFNLDDIESIDRISKLPKGVRTNGSSTDKIKLGNFKFENYGASKVYVHADINDIIVIKLSDKYIFLNGETYKETEEYYNILKENS